MKSIFLFSLLFFSYLAVAQVDTLTIEFDNKRNVIKNPTRTIKKGKLYGIKLKGINTAYMDITIKGAEKELISPIPEFLIPIIPGVNTSLGNNKSLDENTILQSIPPNPYSHLFAAARAYVKPLKETQKYSIDIYKKHQKNEIDVKTIAVEKTIRLLKEFDVPIITLETYTLSKSKYDSIIENSIENLDFQKLVVPIKLKINTLFNVVPGLTLETYPAQVANNDSQILEALKNLDIQNVTEDVSIKLAEFLDIYAIKLDVYEQGKTMFDAKLIEVVTQAIGQIKSTRIFFEGELNNGMKSAEDIRDSKITDLHANLSQLESKFKLEVYSRYLNLILSSQNFKNEKSFPKTYFSSEDVLETSITILNTYTKDTLYNNKIDFYTRSGGFRLNFSTGFFYNDIVEKSYSLRKRDSVSNSVLEERADDFDISIGGLAHLTYKFSSFTDIGANIGVSVSPLDGNTRYLLGLGILVGKKNKLGITAGSVISRINTLASSVQTDGRSSFVPIAVTSVPLTKNNEWGFYFGITYNLLRSKK